MQPDMYCPRCGHNLSGTQLRKCPTCGWKLARVSESVSDPPGDGSGTVGLMVEFFGRYTREQVTQSWSDNPRPSTPRIDQAIATTWSQEQASASRHGRALYNGELGRLVRVDVTPSSLRMKLGSTSYRDFLGTNLNNAGLVCRERPEALANPLGTSVTVITDDHYLAFGRRSERVAYHARHLHPFGGMLEKADRQADEACDVFAAATRELHEELNVQGADIAEIVIIGLVCDCAIMQPELLFKAKLTVSRGELTERFGSASDKDEHTRLEFVRAERDAIVPFLEAAAPVSAVAKGALVLFGRARWGEPWYEETCRRVFGSVPTIASVPSSCKRTDMQ